MKAYTFALALLLAACQPALTSIPVTPLPTPTLPAVSTASVTLAREVITLPLPRSEGSLSLEEAIARRRSVRSFSDSPLTLQELGQLLWAAQGVTGPAGLRTAPSAGALYPLELYAVTRDGVYHYEPTGHRLAVLSRTDARNALYMAALQQGAVQNAPAVIVIAADYARTAVKYGEGRTPRYVHLEAGHAAQNLVLQAVALDLGAVTIGAFEDDGVKQALALPANHTPLYLIPIGHPQ